MKIKLIAATSLNNVIGNSSTNNIPWHYKEDLQFFKQQTLHRNVLMGRNTFASIGKPLPNRNNIVLSRRIVPRLPSSVSSFLSLGEALNSLKNEEAVWVIGGATVYSETLAIADELYITAIPLTIEDKDNIYFPKIDRNVFEIKETIEISKEKNLYCNVYCRELLQPKG